MKRVSIEQGVYIKINDNGKLSPKPFEIKKGRTFSKLGDAVKLFKALYSHWNTVYLYEAKTGYYVEFKAYSNSYEEAVSIRNQVEAVLGVIENEK